MIAPKRRFRPWILEPSFWKAMHFDEAKPLRNASRYLRARSHDQRKFLDLPVDFAKRLKFLNLPALMSAKTASRAAEDDLEPCAVISSVLTLCRLGKTLVLHLRSMCRAIAMHMLAAKKRNSIEVMMASMRSHRSIGPPRKSTRSKKRLQHTADHPWKSNRKSSG